MRLSMFEGDHGPLEIGGVLGPDSCGPLTRLRSGKELGARSSGWTDVDGPRELLRKRSVLPGSIRIGPCRSFPPVSESEDSIQARPICIEDVCMEVIRRFILARSTKSALTRSHGCFAPHSYAVTGRPPDRRLPIRYLFALKFISTFTVSKISSEPGPSSPSTSNLKARQKKNPPDSRGVIAFASTAFTSAPPYRKNRAQVQSPCWHETCRGVCLPAESTKQSCTSLVWVEMV